MEPLGIKKFLSDPILRKQFTDIKEFYSRLDFILIVLNLYSNINENLMEPSGLEPLTPCMPCRCSTS